MLAHVLLGLVAVGLLAVVFDGAALGRAAGSLVVSFAAFLIAQSSLFSALSRVEASTVAPLLSLKIAALAGLSWWLEGRVVTPVGGAAVLLAIVGAAVVGGVGQRPDRRSLGLILLAVAAYACCDMGIVRGIEAVVPADAGTGPRLGAGLLCMSAMYVGLGVLAVCLLPRVLRRNPTPRRALWGGAALYAACWAGAIGTLYSGFALLPVVLVSILQSTRALWSVVLGGVLGRLGWTHLEADRGNAALAVRVAGAAGLVAAVGLYAWASG